MKYLIHIVFVCVMPFFGYAQTGEPANGFGFALNSSMNGEVYPIRLIPSITYLNGKSQYELGFGFHPFIHTDQNILSGDFNYKYFPNGIGNKYNMYLITSLSYVNNKKLTYYPTKYKYVFLNGGYGFEINAFKGAYLGTNITTGAFTYQVKSKNPYEGFAKNELFDEFRFNLAFQFNVGYRF